jgi:hypothetical protein
VYSLFLSRFVQHTVGVTRFRERIENANLATLDEEEADRLCTVTDEAFTLVTIENNYNRWVDIVKRNKYSFPKPSKKNEPKQFLSNERPRFTSGGNVYTEDESENSLKTKGWTTEGINRYNSLYQKVTKDRENHPEFLLNFIKEERAQSESNKVGKRPKPKSNPYLQACCDPLSDIEEVAEEDSSGESDAESEEEDQNGRTSQNGRKRRRVGDNNDDDDDGDDSDGDQGNDDGDGTFIYCCLIRLC